MRFTFTPLLAALALTACAGSVATGARNMSVAKLGCPSDEITVSHVDYGLGAASWQAECRGKVILCSVASDPNHRNQVECTAPAAGQESPAPASP